MNRQNDEARALILEFGWNSTCYQILNEGIEHWWTLDRRAIVGFVRSGGMAIVAGAPVCAYEGLETTIQEFEAFAAQEGLGVCYFGAEDRLQQLLMGSRDYVQVNLGSQPEWSPDYFLNRISSDSSLRAQLNRARNKGVVVREWTAKDGTNSPVLEAVLHQWLETRGLPTLHFLVEPATLSELRDRRLFVADIAGQVIGFVTLCPVPSRNGWLTEQFVRGREAPNGTVELMLNAAAQAVAADGSTYFTMGIVPLVSPKGVDVMSEPGWLSMLRRWAQAHYTRFYNFRGLSEFKTKFHPEHWQPVVVVVKDGRFRLRHLRHIGKAFTRTSPELAMVIGIGKAARTEISRLFN